MLGMGAFRFSLGKEERLQGIRKLSRFFLYGFCSGYTFFALFVCCSCYSLPTSAFLERVGSIGSASL